MAFPLGYDMVMNWIEATQHMTSELNLKSGESFSPYGFFLCGVEASKYLSAPNVFADLPVCDNTDLLTHTGAHRGKSGPVPSVPVATTESVKQAEVEASEAMRHMITPNLSVDDITTLFWSAISVDFSWLNMFKEDGDDISTVINQTDLGWVGDLSDPKLYTRLETDTGLLIELIEKEAGLQATDTFRIINGTEFDQHAVSVRPAVNKSYKIVCSEWSQECNHQNVPAGALGFRLEDILSEIGAGNTVNIAQEVKAEFDRQGFAAAALSTMRLKRGFTPMDGYQVIVDWTKMDHYCVCSDPESGAVLFVSDVPKAK